MVPHKQRPEITLSPQTTVEELLSGQWWSDGRQTWGPSPYCSSQWAHPMPQWHGQANWRGRPMAVMWVMKWTNKAGVQCMLGENMCNVRFFPLFFFCLVIWSEFRGSIWPSSFCIFFSLPVLTHSAVSLHASLNVICKHLQSKHFPFLRHTHPICHQTRVWPNLEYFAFLHTSNKKREVM